MNNPAALEIIDEYYKVTRQVGHTSTMLVGVLSRKSGVIIVAANGHHAETLRRQIDKIPEHMLGNRNGIHIVTVEGIKFGALRGRNVPLVIDNFAINELMHDCKKVWMQRWLPKDEKKKLRK